MQEARVDLVGAEILVASEEMDRRQRSARSARSRALSTLPTLDNGKAS